jgi:gas vesicle protein
MDKDIILQKQSLEELKTLLSQSEVEPSKYFALKARILKTHFHIRNKLKKGRNILCRKVERKVAELQTKREQVYPVLLRKREFESFRKEKFDNLSKLPKLTKKLKKLSLKMPQEQISKLFSDVHQKIKKEIEKNQTKLEELRKLKEQERTLKEKVKDLDEDIREMPHVISEIKREVRAKFDKNFGDFECDDLSGNFESNFEVVKKKFRDLLKEGSVLANGSHCAPNFNHSKCLKQILEIKNLIHFKKELKQNLEHIIKIEITHNPNPKHSPSNNTHTLHIYLLKVKQLQLPLTLITSQSSQVVTAKLLQATQIQNQPSFEPVFPHPQNILESILSSSCSAFSFRLLQNLSSWLNACSSRYFRKLQMIQEMDSFTSDHFSKSSYEYLLDSNWNLNFSLQQMIQDLMNRKKSGDLVNDTESGCMVSCRDHVYLIKSSNFDFVIIVFENEFADHKMLYVSASKVQKLLQINLPKFEQDFVDCLVLPRPPSIAPSVPRRFQNKACVVQETALKLDLLDCFDNQKGNFISVIRKLI